MNALNNLLVLGAGSAGLLAALTVKRKMPQVAVRVVRSPDIGVIGVGESTTPNIPAFLFDFLGISRRWFYQHAEPTWKLGIHFLWGPRDSFDYSFIPALDGRQAVLPRPNGYYCDDNFADMNLCSSLMAEKKAFARNANGGPEIDAGHAFHLENIKFVRTLEMLAKDCGIEFIDGKLSGVQRSPEGISEIILEDGRHITADFFIDASGFRSELLGKALEEPFIRFDKSLFNDRAITGSWDRAAHEPTLPYTTAETMNSGWSWRIDHEHVIHRGYVYSSDHISDDEARAEFAAKNPRAKIGDRVVRFQTGRYQRTWVGNVMAIGNSAGFVEPLEATALMVICTQCMTFADMVRFVGPTPSIRDLFNRTMAATWDEIRDFLTMHYKINTRIDTPYWRRCLEEADASRLKDLLDFYAENGPTGFCRYHIDATLTNFGIEGYLVMLVGNKVPYRNRHAASESELQRINQLRAQNRAAARQGLTVEESLAYIRHPNWRWFAESTGSFSPS
jgi:tryptophan halogenase